MSEVFLCRTGQLSNAGRRDLKRAGVVVVEVEDPAECQFIRSTETIAADDMLWAALHALNVVGQYDSTGKIQREQLAKNLFSIMMDQRQERKERKA
jgi:hypothetical protein